MAKIRHIALSTQAPEATAKSTSASRWRAWTPSPNSWPPPAPRGATTSTRRSGVGKADQRYANVGPDGVMLDVSETGWVGATGFRP